MSPQKKRALPPWMKQQNSSEANSSSGKVCDDDLPSCSTFPNGREKTVTRNAVDTLSDESDIEEDRGIKKRILDHLDNTPDERCSDVMPPLKTCESDQDSEKIQDQEDQQPVRNSSPLLARRSLDDDSSTPSNVGGVMGSPSAKSPIDPAQITRKSCYYGSSCYRKNPQHRSDFAHPGDTDYCEAASSSSGAAVVAPDNRPLCEYGSACYRKNPQHQRDYRHDRPNSRKARPAGMHDIPSDDDGDFNGTISSDDFKPGESESDDSFVTSDSISSGNSEYEPSDDDEKDKLKRKKKAEQKEKIKRGKASG